MRIPLSYNKMVLTANLLPSLRQSPSMHPWPFLWLQYFIKKFIYIILISLSKVQKLFNQTFIQSVLPFSSLTSSPSPLKFGNYLKASSSLLIRLLSFSLSEINFLLPVTKLIISFYDKLKIFFSITNGFWNS